MPVQTAIQHRRGAAATWTSTNPTLAAGEIGFETDTGKFKIGTGSTAWNSLSYFNPGAVASPLTTKGDLWTYSTTDARLAAGSNGDTLVADSAATVGLRYSGGVGLTNPVINGGFDIWQRGTSFSFNNNTAYTADRWACVVPNTGATISRQTTGDTTNLPFIQYCARLARNSGTTNTGTLGITQSFETTNSLFYAGKTVTMSFYARAGANFSASGSSIVVYLITGTGTDQNHTVGGYTGQATPINTTATLTTTWQRFSFTGTIAATATEIAVNTGYTPVGTAGAADYYEITGWQIDVGNTALPFRRSGGTIQGELAACQRYYWRAGGDGTYTNYGWARGIGTTTVRASIQCPVQMRVAPTAVEFSNLGVGDMVSVSSAITGLTLSEAGKYVTLLEGTGATGLTAGTIYAFRSNNSSSGYVALSAEL